MKISKKIEAVINTQITAELWSSNLYLSMAFFMEKEGYQGFSKWLKEQSYEEKAHAESFANYLVTRGGTAVIDQINVVPQGWGTVLELFEHVYEHECHVSEMINKIMDEAVAEKDYATQDFIMTFVREQVEEEATAEDLVQRIKQAGTQNLLFLDKYMQDIHKRG